jgi:hypothetical protein
LASIGKIEAVVQNLLGLAHFRQCRLGTRFMRSGYEEPRGGGIPVPGGHGVVA